MDFGVVELKFLFKDGTERKFKVAASSEITDDSLRGVVAGIVKMFVEDNDYPVMTDIDGRVFALPSLESMMLIEAREIQKGR